MVRWIEVVEEQEIALNDCFGDVPTGGVGLGAVPERVVPVEVSDENAHGKAFLDDVGVACLVRRIVEGGDVDVFVVAGRIEDSDRGDFFWAIVLNFLDGDAVADNEADSSSIYFLARFAVTIPSEDLKSRDFDLIAIVEPGLVDGADVDAVGDDVILDFGDFFLERTSV